MVYFIMGKINGLGTILAKCIRLKYSVTIKFQKDKCDKKQRGTLEKLENN